LVIKENYTQMDKSHESSQTIKIQLKTVATEMPNPLNESVQTVIVNNFDASTQIEEVIVSAQNSSQTIDNNENSTQTTIVYGDDKETQVDSD